jgi:hypothetical protein
MSAMAHDAAVAHGQGAIADSNGRQGRFQQRRSQPAIPLASFTRAVVARAFVLAGTKSCPTRQMSVSGKKAHIHPHLSDQGFGGTLVNPVDAIQACHLLNERADDFLDPLTDGTDGLIEVVQMRQDLDY